MRPTELPEVRQKMIGHFASEWGQDSWFAVAEHSGFFGEAVTRTRAEDALKGEVSRWALAELFYVTEDMTILAREAAKTMPTYSLAPKDLPAPHGLLYFDGLLGESRTSEDPDRPPLPIVACLWGTITLDTPDGSRPAVWLSFYTDANQVRDEALSYYDGDLDAIDRLQATHAKRGPLIYDDEALLLYGANEAEEAVGKTERYYMVRCAWLLMQQSVATVETQHPDRPTRRRLAKVGVEAAPVRIVRLRHAASEGGGGTQDREYHHRWLVRGHWRKQWHPKQDRHVPIWISPHVKGPDGAPLLGGEKVYVWER